MDSLGKMPAGAKHAASSGRSRRSYRSSAFAFDLKKAVAKSNRKVKKRRKSVTLIAAADQRGESKGGAGQVEQLRALLTASNAENTWLKARLHALERVLRRRGGGRVSANPLPLSAVQDIRD